MYTIINIPIAVTTCTAYYYFYELQSTSIICT